MVIKMAGGGLTGEIKNNKRRVHGGKSTENGGTLREKNVKSLGGENTRVIVSDLRRPEGGIPGKKKQEIGVGGKAR